MRIISKFKDYYDYVANQYGGGDPRVVYERKAIADCEQGSLAGLHVRFPVRVTTDFKLPNNVFLATRHRRGAKPCALAVAVIGDRAFGLIAESSKENGQPAYRLLEEKDLDRTLGKDTLWGRSLRSEVLYVQAPAYAELTRKVGHPVYLIIACEVILGTEGKGMAVTVAPECPVLAELGLPSVVSAEQVYQDIAYFMGNTMRGSPDIDTPVKLADKDRIVQHGFDLKQSFRHRK